MNCIFGQKSWDSGGGQGDSWLSNGGANYVATFKVGSIQPLGSAQVQVLIKLQLLPIYTGSAKIHRHGAVISNKLPILTHLLHLNQHGTAVPAGCQ